MPLGSQQQRLITAAVGLPVLAAAVVAGGWPLALLVAAASVVAMHEFFRMIGRPGPVLETAGLVLGVAVVASGVRGGWPVAATGLGLALWIEQAAFLGRFAWRGEKHPPRAALAAALLYIPFSLRFLCVFSALETAFVLAVVMAADTGAYYAGRFIGGPKVWPAVSPGKTWAGTVGGLAASALTASAFAATGTFGAAGPLALAGCGVVLAAVSQMGDFFESALKRAAGIKDSGTLLPGHGGMLDRIDGLLPAVLAYAAGRSLLGLG
jgi:phosphatidate cytidylyltransferase